MVSPAEARELADEVAIVFDAEADRTEEGRTLSPKAVEATRDAGLFWMAVPTSLGGLGLDVVSLIEVVEALSRADGSAGWTVMANALSTGVASAFCDDDTVETMFGGSEKAIVAGMLGPGGRAVEVDGGILGSGAYSFGSGAAHASWIGAGMFVIEHDRPRTLPSGLPEVRVCVLPRDRVRMLDNWDVMGLVGTGSFDYEVPEQFIPAGASFERTSIEPRRGGPIFTLGIAGFGAAGHGAVALGIAARALEEISVLAPTKKRPGYPSSVADHPVFRHELARQDAAHQAVRAFLFEVYRDAQATVMAGRQLTTLQRARFRQSVTYLHEVAADVVRFCYQWGGSDALRNPSPLGRCMRDMAGATQHVYVDPMTLVDAAPPVLADWAGTAERRTRGKR